MGIILKILSKYWKYILIITLIISLYLMYNKLSNISKDNKRLSNNIEQLELYKDNSRLNLTKEEFFNFKKDLIKEISDSLKIKGKQISNVTNVYNSYIDSSKTIHETNQLSDSTYRITVDENCFSFSGIHNIYTKQFKLDYKRFDDTIRIIDYWSRDRIFKSSWLPKWGKKHYYRDSYSKCGSSIKTEEITIIKK